jgi:Ca2+-binding EF-hand superfamily protein
MKSTLYRVVLSGTVLIGTLLLPATTTAQDQMRFRAMDRNRDGVVTRAEWQGSDQSFRQQNRNGDGILSGDEVRVAQGADTENVFALVDFDGNGKVTTQEWKRAFTQLDVNRDGVLTEDELRSRSTPPVPTRAFQAGRDRGLNDGRRAGRDDRDQRGVWDLEGQRELEQTDAGYRSKLGPRDQYQAGYLEGFRQGYAEGYGPRRGTGTVAVPVSAGRPVMLRFRGVACWGGE